LNFAQYLFLRKLHLGWKKCALDDTLSSKQVACALYVSVPTRPLGLPEATEIFNIAMQVTYGFNQPRIVHLPFKSYFEITRLYYIFATYELPFKTGRLKEKDMLRSIEQGLAPSDMPISVINRIFDVYHDPDNLYNKDYLVFPEFVMYWHIY